MGDRGEGKRPMLWNDEKDGVQSVNEMERNEGKDDLKHVLGQFLSWPDQYRCDQSLHRRRAGCKHTKGGTLSLTDDNVG